MKHIIAFALGLLTLATPVFGCANWMPVSSFEEARANNGLGRKPVPKCESLEDCVCYDGVLEWPATFLGDRLVKDKERPIYAHDCPQGRKECSPVGYETKVEGKMAFNDPVKLAEVKASQEREETARQEKAKTRKAAKEKLKEFDDSKTYTAAQLKTFIKALIEKEE